MWKTHTHIHTWDRGTPCCQYSIAIYEVYIFQVPGICFFVFFLCLFFSVLIFSSVLFISRLLYFCFPQFSLTSSFVSLLLGLYFLLVWSCFCAEQRLLPRRRRDFCVFLLRLASFWAFPKLGVFPCMTTYSGVGCAPEKRKAFIWNRGKFLETSRYPRELETLSVVVVPVKHASTFPPGKIFRKKKQFD